MTLPTPIPQHGNVYCTPSHISHSLFLNVSITKLIEVSDSKFITGYTTYVISSVCTTLIDHTAIKICGMYYAAHETSTILQKPIKEKLWQALLTVTCSTLDCRDAKSHKECKSRIPHNKYLNSVSSLSDDIRTPRRCKGRKAASFSISIWYIRQYKIWHVNG